MGNRRENERRVGVTRPGPAERARKEREREAARQRQRQCRLQMRERAALEVVDMQAEEADDMDADDSSLGCNRREVRRSAAATLSFVEDTLARYNNRDKEAVLRSVWSSSVTTVNFPITKRVSSELQAWENIVSGLVQSLSEVKSSRSRSHLVTKHAILTIAVSLGIQSTARQTARVLGLHHRNLLLVVHRRAAKVSKDHMHWTLSIRKIRSDVVTKSVKEAVVCWWVAETRPSPNVKEVVRKWVVPGIYEKMHTQYLLESQVKYQAFFQSVGFRI
jgi:hypothetical protein